MDYEALSSELIRALRGQRSQAGLSRRIRAKSNVVNGWESGAGFPTAARFMHLVSRVGKDPASAVSSFYGRVPAWLDAADLTTSSGIALFLSDLQGQATLLELAERSGRSRFALSRWLKGQAQPRLPDFLRLIEACTLRMLDFVAAFVDPATLGQTRNAWETLLLSRQAAFDSPWSHALLRLLETRAYRELEPPESGWLASRLGISEAEERTCLDLLARTKQIRWRRGRWRPGAPITVDTRSNPTAARRLAAWWAQIAADRLLDNPPGNFAYNLCGVSETDLKRIRDLQRAYFAQLRAIVAESQPVERVVLVNMQLCELDHPSDSAG